MIRFGRGTSVAGVAIAGLLLLGACGGGSGEDDAQRAGSRSPATQATTAPTSTTEAPPALGLGEAPGKAPTPAPTTTSTTVAPAPTPPAAPTNGLTQCDPGLSVNAVTSCPFAREVRDTYQAFGGQEVIDVYSPVTKLTYTMTCLGAIPVVCTGGNNAQVYIR